MMERFHTEILFTVALFGIVSFLFGLWIIGLRQLVKARTRSLEEKERKYRTIFENMQDVYYRTDMDGSVLDMSPSIQRYTGYLREELLGKPIAGLYERRDDWGDLLSAVQEKGEVFDVIVRMRTKDGRPVRASVNARKLQDRSGETLGMEGSLRDVTDRESMKEAMHRQLRFSKALNEIASVIASLDEEEQVMQKTADVVGSTLSLDRALIYIIDLKANQAVALCEWLNPADPSITSTKATYDLNLFKCGSDHMVETRHCLMSHCDDIHESFLRGDGSAALLHENMNIKSLLWYPLYFLPERYGVLVLNQVTSRRDWLPDEVEFVGSVAHQVSLALQKIRMLEESRRADTALQEAVTATLDEKAKTEALIAALGDGLSIQDTSYRILYQNKIHANMMGRHVGKYCYEAYEHGDQVCEGCPVSMSYRDGNVHSAVRTAVTDAGQIYVDITASPLRDAAGNIVAGIELTRDITERKKMEEQVLEAKLVWEETFDTINDAITIHDREFNIIRMNKAATKLIEQAPLEILGRKCFETYHGTTHPPECCPACETLKTGRIAVMERFEPKLNKFIEVRTLPRFDKEKNIVGLVHIVVDITDRKKAERENKDLQARLFQAQKMESIGRLAGGVAHDFNNILSAIIGYSEIVMRKPDLEPTMREKLEVIKTSGVKAAELTRQLLAFSRKQVLTMGIYDLNDIVSGMMKMIVRVLGEDIVITLDLGKHVSPVTADKAQVEQVLLNLAVNARDAMPSGGHLTIATQDVRLDEEYERTHTGVPAGPYVMLMVSDTGTGMTAEVRESIFEPFFTTKDQGKGTGLGLATVYGIVKQHNGQINVYSEPGEGTTFKVYFPASRKAAQEEAAPADRELPRGSETILVVDDDPVIRDLVVDILDPLGYGVVAVATGEEALKAVDVVPGPIDILLVDVIMPGMNGKEIADAALEKRPSIKVIFMSGYHQNAIARHGILETGAVLIQKPLTSALLANTVRSVLDGRP